jgi:hypothetical protein
MLAHLSSLDVFIWSAMALAQTCLSALVIYRKLNHRYPAFAFFIYFATLKTWLLMAIPSVWPWTYFWAYYALQVGACVLMAMAVGELYVKTFGKRWARVPAWAPRNVGLWLAAAISSCALLAVALKPIGVNRYLALMSGIHAALVSALLISLIILAVYSRHLGIGFRPWPQRIAIGFFIFLSVNGATLYMVGITQRDTAAVVRRTGMLAYVVSLLWWGISLWGRETVPEEATTEQIEEMVSAHRRTVSAAAQLTEMTTQE